MTSPGRRRTGSNFLADASWATAHRAGSGGGVPGAGPPVARNRAPIGRRIHWTSFAHAEACTADDPLFCEGLAPRARATHAKKNN
jgi:hypothetical protein